MSGPVRATISCGRKTATGGGMQIVDAARRGVAPDLLSVLNIEPVAHRTGHMAQIFHRTFNVIARASIYGAAFIAAALGWVALKAVRSPYATNAFVAVEQPV